jgi:hypothetical protein
MTNQFIKPQRVTDTTKGCSLCLEMKPFTEFHKDKTNIKGNGLAYYCKACANQQARKYTADNRENPSYKRKKKNNYVKNRFGISVEQYEKMLKEQDYKCAICKIDLPLHGYFTHLDHCHSSGKIRKFLCSNCNRGLGHFMDNPEFLMSAIKYLDAHTDDGNQKEGTGL